MLAMLAKHHRHSQQMRSVPRQQSFELREFAYIDWAIVVTRNSQELDP
jgi:hypothetical protein